MLSTFIFLLFAILGASWAMPADVKMHKATQVSGTYGLDLSQYFTVSAFQCLKEKGYDFAIVRAYQSTGKPQPKDL